VDILSQILYYKTQDVGKTSIIFKTFQITTLWHSTPS
jgi:hypothetical protein